MVGLQGLTGDFSDGMARYRALSGSRAFTEITEVYLQGTAGVTRRYRALQGITGVLQGITAASVRFRAVQRTGEQ